MKTFKTTVNLEGKDYICSWDSEKVKLNKPFNSLLAALGGCTIHTITQQADLKNIPIESITVESNASYDVARFYKEIEGNNTFEKIDININLKTSEKDKDKLNSMILEAEKRCPVNQTLRLAGIKINTNTKYL